jgi:hypothetical protein
MKLILFFFNSFVFFASIAKPCQPIHLRINEGNENIDPGKMTFSWQMECAEAKNRVQTAYQIIIYQQQEFLNQGVALIWDTKKTVSSNSINIHYSGPELNPATHYLWSVKIWDNTGKESEWAISSSFQTTLLELSDWKGAQWIGYEEIADSAIIVPAVHQNGKKSWGKRINILPIFRKLIYINKPVEQATVFACGLGQFDLRINQVSVSGVLEPGWTQYDHHSLFVSHSISHRMIKGENLVEVQLGNGFYYIPGQRYRKLTGAFGLPKLICTIVIKYTDGTKEYIISDGTWKTAPSPVTFSSIYGGEDYDATINNGIWNTAGFQYQSWQQAVIVKGHPLQPQHFPGLIKGLVFHQSVQQKSRSVFVYDFGQNMAGVPEIDVSGNAGDTVTITPGELLDSLGYVTQKQSGAPHTYNYILKGQSNQHWQPLFTYYGFRYVQVGLKANNAAADLPVINSLVAMPIVANNETVGKFTTQHNIYAQTNQLILSAIKSNMMSILTDCPHREKLGWLEEAHLMGASIQYNYNIQMLLQKIIEDMQAAQTENGLVPEIAPEYVQFTEPFRDSPEWGSAAIILPWYTYQWYGDKSVLQNAYPMMQKYFNYLTAKATNNLLTQGLSDWYDLGPAKPGFSQLSKQGVTATAMYYYDATILNQIAQILGKSTDELYYATMKSKIKKSFNDSFFVASKNKYGNGSQTELAMALYFDLVPRTKKQIVLQNLISDIENRDYSFTSGDIGFRYLLKTLQQNKRNDIIFKMTNRDDVPGYGYQIKKGATALTESWQALPTVSNNHLMLGHLMEWFYEGLAGIRQAPNSVAFKELIFEPYLNTEIGSAGAVFQTPYGPSSVEWKVKANKYAVKMMVAPNTTATIILPDRKQAKVGSGLYNFEVLIK